MTPLLAVLLALMAAVLFGVAAGVSSAIDKVEAHKRTPGVEFWSSFAQVFLVIAGIILIVTVVVGLMFNILP